MLLPIIIAVLLLHPRPLPAVPAPAPFPSSSPFPSASTTPMATYPGYSSPSCTSKPIAWPAEIPVRAPTPAPWQCDGWLALSAPLGNVLNTPQTSVSLAPPPVRFAEIIGNISVSSFASIQADVYDRISGTFGSAVASIAQQTTPDYAFGHNWFPCVTCQPVTAQNQPLASQGRISPQNGPNSLPANAQIFSTVAFLPNLAPATWHAAFVVNPNSSDEQVQNSGIVGSAQGYNMSSNSTFSDQYFVYQMPTNDKYALSVAGSSTNHRELAGFTHAEDLVGTATYNQPTSATSGVQAFFQYGSQMRSQAQTINAIASYNLARTQSPELNPWDLLLGTTSAAHDLNLAAAFNARGDGFQPPDAPPDVLAGLHGYAGEITLYPYNPVAIPYFNDAENRPDGDQPPARIDFSGWSYGDIVPRYQNLAANATILVAQNLALVGKASRGFIGTKQASSSFVGTPITDAMGGAVPIPQSAVEFDLALSGGHYESAYHRYPGILWSSSVGYALASKAACNARTAGPICNASRYSQLTYSGMLDGQAGFLTGSIGPANLAVQSGVLSQNPDASQLHTGGFLNSSSWSVQGGVHLPSSLQHGVCNSVVVSATNTAQPIDILNAVPGPTVSIATFAEVTPLRFGIPVSALFGVSHQIANANQQSSFAAPASLGSQFVSTVTYAVKLTFGVTQRARPELQSRCVFFKPAP